MSKNLEEKKGQMNSKLRGNTGKAAEEGRIVMRKEQQVIWHCRSIVYNVAGMRLCRGQIMNVLYARLKAFEFYHVGDKF